MSYKTRIEGKELIIDILDDSKIEKVTVIRKKEKKQLKPIEHNHTMIDIPNCDKWDT